MAPRFRTRGRAILIFAGAVFGLLALVVGALHTSPGRELVKRRLLAAVNARLTGRIELERLDYTLFGEVGLVRLVVKDAAGREAVAVDELRLRPVWASLRGDEPALERVSVRGVRVHVVQAADGSSNLSTLVRSRPGPVKTKKRAGRSARYRLAALELDDAGVVVDRPDGSRIALTGAAARASLLAAPAERTIDLAMPVARGSVSLVREKDAVRLAALDVRTGLDLALTKGAGKARVAKTGAAIEVGLPGATLRRIELDLAPIELRVAPGELDAAVGRLSLGALILEAVQLSGRTAKGQLAGDQRAELLGLSLSAAKLNELLGRKVLVSDIDLAAKLEGPADRVAAFATLKTNGGRLELRGTLNLTRAGAPSYDLKLTAEGVDSTRVIHPDLAPKAPPVRIEAISLDLQGSGLGDALATDLALTLGPVQVGKVRVESIDAEGRFEKGDLTVRRLVLSALGQRAVLTGAYELASKRARGDLTVYGDLRDTLAALRAMGVPVQVPLPKTELAEGDVTVHVEGRVDAALQVDVGVRRVPFAGGTVALAARGSISRADAGERPFDVRDLGATLEVHGVDLRSLAALGGRRVTGVEGRVDGKVALRGEVDDPEVEVALHLRARGLEAGRSREPVEVDVRGRATKRTVEVTLKADRRAGTRRERVLEAVATLPLAVSGASRGLSPDAPLSVRIDVPRGPVAELVALLPDEVAAKKVAGLWNGSVEGHARVTGTARRPTGSFELDVSEALVGLSTQRLHVKGELGTRPNARTAVTADARLWLDANTDPVATGRVETELGVSPWLGSSRDLAWSLALDVPPQDVRGRAVASLLRLVLVAKAGARGGEWLDRTRGAISGRVKLAGTRDDVRGDIEASVEGFAHKEVGPLRGRAVLRVAADRTEVDLRAEARDTRFLHATGTIGVPGRGLLRALRERSRLDPPLDLELAVPESKLADLDALAPALAGVPGHVRGKVAVGGRVSAPTLAAALSVDRYETLDGRPGRAAFDASFDGSEVAASMGMGRPGEAPNVRVDAELPLRAGGGLLGIPVAKARARAESVDLRSVIPAFAFQGRPLDVEGRLDVRMDGSFSVKPTLKGLALKANVDGELSIQSGKVSIPGSTRVYRDVELRVVSDAKALRLETLRLSEIDPVFSGAHGKAPLPGAPKRWIQASGRLEWDDLSPERAELALKASNWLLFGPDRLGERDAPRGILSCDLAVTAELDRPVRQVKANFRSLELSIPERFERAHQPKKTSLRDAVFVGENAAERGKLPLPERPEPVKVEPAPQGQAGDGGFDVAIRLPRGARIQQAPIDLLAEGQVNVTIRPGKRVVRGEIVGVGGDVTIGGKKHAFERGRVVFDEQNPGGFMDLHFARTPETLRDISVASGGDGVRVDMVVLSYLASNLPHLLFLDRISAWSDPYESRGSYGHIQHVEAERYSESGKARVRAVTRPPRTGQSESELQLDWLFMSDRRKAFGAGLRGGDRGGGGPNVFFEWSSPD